MTDLGYNLYLYHYGKNYGYSDIEEILDKSGLSDGISILDISDKSKDEGLSDISLLIIAELDRKYSDNDEQVYAHFVRMHDGTFLLVLSVYEGIESNVNFPKLSKLLFKNGKMTSVSIYGNKKKSSYESAYYWKDFVGSIPKYIHTHDKNCAFDIESERFFLDSALAKVLENILIKESTSLKTIITMITGKIMCSVLNTTEILIEDGHVGGTMDRVPIYFDSTLPRNDLYASVLKQLAAAEENDMFSFDRLDDYDAKHEFDNKIVVSQHFKNDKKYSKFLSEMNSDTLYRINPTKSSNVPLNIEYFLVNNQLSVTYCYDINTFGNISIESIHNEFCRLLYDFLSGKEIVPNNFKIAYDADSNRRRIRDLKIRCMRRIGLFEGYTDQEYKDLASLCEFKSFNSKQEIISLKTRQDYLYFITNGLIEVSGLDAKKYLRPLHMVKVGDIIGIESLLDDNISKVQYTVYSANAILLACKKDIFMEEAQKHPQMLLRLIEIQSMRLYKFEKLWMTT